MAGASQTPPENEPEVIGLKDPLLSSSKPSVSSSISCLLSMHNQCPLIHGLSPRPISLVHFPNKAIWCFPALPHRASLRTPWRVSLFLCLHPRAPITSILVPHRQHAENKGAECGCKEPSPVVVHSKVRGRDLDAEQHSCRGTNVGSGVDKRGRLSPTPWPCGPLQVHALNHTPIHGGSTLQARDVVQQDTERMRNGWPSTHKTQGSGGHALSIP